MDVSPSAVLACRQLRRTLGEGPLANEVIRGIDLDIAPATFVSIVGHSGSGKSTLLYLLGALDRPNAGQVLLEGQDLSRLDDNAIAAVRNRKMGFVFQFHHLLAEFTAAENVMLPMIKLGVRTRSAAYERARELLGWFGLASKADRPSRRLSGGEQQRVAIARALANDPRVILADEPTGNLDSTNTALVFDCFLRIVRELGQTVVMVTHEPDLAERTDRIITLVDGRVSHDQTVREQPETAVAI